MAKNSKLCFLILIILVTKSVSFGQETWTSTSITNAPVGRTWFSAAWTGNKMIVWGGVGAGNESFNNGGIYDPVTSVWTPTSTVNAPDNRYLHSAIWTGSKMIVWGGTLASGWPTNTGGIYDPATNSWASTSMVNAPGIASIPTIIWTGSKMIVWGGNGSGTGGVYDPASDSWTAISMVNAPTTVYYFHTAIWTGSKMIVWGGRDANCTGGIYDPVTNTWASMSNINAPEPTFAHTAVWTGSKMITWGGAVWGDVNYNTGGIYDPAINTWTATSTTNAPTGRSFHTAVWTGSKMIVWGGLDANGFPSYAPGGVFDPSSNTWTAITTSNAPENCRFARAFWTGANMIAWGGSTSVYLNTGGIYSPGPNMIPPILGQTEPLIYPNPAKDLVNIISKEIDKIESVRIISIKGEVVYDENINQTEVTLNTRNYNAGIYIIQVKTQNNFFTNKITITRY